MSGGESILDQTLTNLQTFIFYSSDLRSNLCDMLDICSGEELIFVEQIVHLFDQNMEKMGQRDYVKAVELLNSLQSNAQTIAKMNHKASALTSL